jgi:SAM-dependent methyltransferase
MRSGLRQKLTNALIRLLRNILRHPMHYLLWLEQSRAPANITNELATMYAFLFKHIARVGPSSVLDVGTGTSSLPHLISHCGPNVIAVDKFSGYWARRPFNRHYFVSADDICSSRVSGMFDLITCIDVLQHVPQHLLALENMARLLRPGGIAVVCCFFNDKCYIPDVYSLRESSMFGRAPNYACQILSRTEIDGWLLGTGLKIADEELWNFFTGKYWTTGERRSIPLLAKSSELHHVICLCLEKY